ncbi:thiopurine S-methyltransferase [Zestomonas thermotolerans]|uniref:thiopurine S-methyltransferase n=1 Tax=Zestomonas thermotolerans TaxID=157784 RepID=UPI0023F52D10|nr:thiopurine S-methyltransferase [Pseudomonas thermotolerans]
MQESFWQERWARDQIGFHQAQVTPYLRRHWPALQLPADSQVLVPLCGKTLDMCWLAERGHAVLGVELVEKAVQAFFAENGLEPQISQHGAFTCYRADNIELYCGDFFALGAADVARCVAFYDRAALIALPEALRRRYREHLQAILPVTCQGLVITLEYDQTQMDGPPFSVSRTEMEQGFSSWQLEELQREDVLEGNWKFVRHSLTALDEVTYHLRRG